MTTNLHIGRPIKWIQRGKKKVVATTLLVLFRLFYTHPKNIFYVKKDTTIYDNNGRFQIELISKEMFWKETSMGKMGFWNICMQSTWNIELLYRFYFELSSGAKESVIQNCLKVLHGSTWYLFPMIGSGPEWFLLHINFGQCIRLGLL